MAELLPTGGTEGISKRIQAFVQLKPLCSMLLPLRSDPQQLSAKLAELSGIIVGADTAGLRACFDYILFPVMLVVDSIPQTRGSFLGESSEKDEVPIPAAKSDKVAEASLAVCRALLQQCKLHEDEIIPLLTRFCPIFAMDRQSVTEEVRNKALGCLSLVLANSRLHALANEEHSALVGYLLRNLIRIAGEEVQAGQKGSKAIRAATMQILRQFIEALAANHGEPTLAYLMPGIFSALGNALLIAGTSHGLKGRTGAAASTAAAIAALQALVALVCAVLGDEDGAHDAEPESDTSHGSATAKALAALQQMHLGLQSKDKPTSTVHTTGTQTPPRKFEERETKFVLQRDAAWRAATAERLNERLKHILPPLLAHPRPAVRQALAAGVVRLLQRCQVALASSADSLLDVLFALAQDEWPEVAITSMAYLRSCGVSCGVASGSEESSANPNSSAGASELPQIAAAGAAMRLMSGLPASLQEGNEAGVLQARKLVTALQVAGKQQVAGMLRNPGKLAVVCQSLLRSFAYERLGAGLLMYAGSHHTNSLAALPSIPSPSGQNQGLSDKAEGDSKAGQLLDGAVLLPRMPLGLSFVSDSRSYEALAAVCRTLGRLAAADGGLALQSLLGYLQQCLHDNIAEPSKASLHSSWQCEAAAVVTLVTEVAFGASRAWQPSSWLGEEVSTNPQQANLVSLIGWLQEDLTEESLWGVQTHNRGSADPDNPSLQLSPQALGENVILVRSLLDAVGTFARASGKQYAASGTLLRVVLLPTLERLGDPCPAIAATAAVTVDSICLHSGYAGLQDLVANNLDYIVDGVCARLRNIDRHPRAPFLFAVLLQKAGVAPELLPLLVEPARASVRGLSITARRKQPGHITAFLAALKEIVAGAALDAGCALADMQAVAAGIAAELEARQACASSTADFEQPNFLNRPEGMSEAEAFFRQHLEEKGAESHDTEVEEPDHRKQVNWTTDDWAAAQRRQQRLHAIATLAASATEASSPLLTNRSLQVVLLAMEVSLTALQALQQTTAALDISEYKIEPFVRQQAAATPVAPDTPKVLPHVHQLWGPLLAALKDSRILVLERALAAIAELAVVSGGQFLAIRMKVEAWPVMARLLKEGPPLSSPGHSRALLGGSEPLAPATIRRARQAVLEALNSAAGSQEGRATLKGFAADAVEAGAHYIAGSEPVAIRNAARKLLVRLAQVDYEAVRLLLGRIADSGQAGKLPANPRPDQLQPLSESRPSRGSVSSLPLSLPLPRGSAEIANVLLEAVEKLQSAGHSASKQSGGEGPWRDCQKPDVFGPT